MNIQQAKAAIQLCIRDKTAETQRCDIAVLLKKEESMAGPDGMAAPWLWNLTLYLPELFSTSLQAWEPEDLVREFKASVLPRIPHP